MELIGLAFPQKLLYYVANQVHIPLRIQVRWLLLRQLLKCAFNVARLSAHDNFVEELVEGAIIFYLVDGDLRGDL